MLWEITDHSKALEYSECELVFPGEEILDSLQVHDKSAREQTTRALASLCSNVMQVLNRYELLNYSVLRDYQRCLFVGRDLALLKI
jgi:hypothetical protein